MNMNVPLLSYESFVAFWKCEIVTGVFGDVVHNWSRAFAAYYASILPADLKETSAPSNSSGEGGGSHWHTLHNKGMPMSRVRLSCARALTSTNL